MEWAPYTGGRPSSDSGLASSSSSNTNTGQPMWDMTTSGSTMYIFTFLATAMILGAIVMSFVVRVMYARRQYSAALRRAIANGDPLPEYRNPLFPSSRYDPNGAFIIPPWLLPVPKLHEDEMNLVYSVEVDHVDTKEKGRIGDGDDDGWDEKWQWISPISLTYIHDPTPAPYIPPPPAPKLPPVSTEITHAMNGFLPRRRARRAARREARREAREARARARTMRETEWVDPDDSSVPVVGEAPGSGSEMRLGLLIAMPAMDAQVRASWCPQDPENAGVPEVCLGLMEVCVEPEVEMVPIGVEEMDVVEAVFETPHTQSMFIEEKWKGKEKELPPIPVLSRGTTSAS